MIRSWLFAFLFIVSALHAFAQTPQLHITVVDTRGAAVAGARVELARPNGSIVAVESTTTEGIASFTKAAEANYVVRVLAAGFTPATLNATDDATVRLRVGSVAQTVVVSADRTSIAENASGSKTSTLDASALTNLQPVSTADALRVMRAPSRRRTKNVAGSTQN